MRKKLTAEAEKADGPKTSARGLKSHQIHELEVAKGEESERLRKALGISEDYEEGSYWKKQEERLRNALEEKGRNEEPRSPDR